MFNEVYRIPTSINNERTLALLPLLIVFIVLISNSSFAQGTGTEISHHFGTYGAFSPSIYGGTLPRIELLAGVLSHTSWIDLRGPVLSGNAYFQELHTFFKPYKGHIAVRMAERLTKGGFAYDAPPNFILSLSALPELTAKNAYSDYLVGRAKGKNRLEQFRVALKNLSEESDFMEFYKSHAEDYKKWVNECTADYDAKGLTRWLESFFGWSGEEFHIVFAPAMFPGGGYAAHYTIDDKLTIYQVIREHGKSLYDPYFGTSSDLEALSLHELGHAFVNPSIEAYQDLINDYRLIDFYKKVEKQMQMQAYGSVNAFLNESVLRAVTAIAHGDFADNNDVQDQWSRSEKSKGFLLQDVIVTSLLTYRRERTQYVTFRDYVPVLLKVISDARPELLSRSIKHSDSRTHKLTWFVVMIVGILLGAIWWHCRKRAALQQCILSKNNDNRI